MAKGNKYLFVRVENLTACHIVVVTERATAKTVVDFLKEKIILRFGPLELLVSDNATCFVACAVQNFIQTIDIRWNTVLDYAPMFNGWAERIVGTINQSVANFVASSGV